MVKVRKIIVATVGIILVIAGILIVVVQWFNWDRYRDDIAIWISSLTSQEVSIDGLIEIKLFPSPRVILTGVSVRDSKDELDEQYVHIGSVTARFDLINIFSGDLVLDQLWVNQLQFQVQADRDGQLEKRPRKHSDSPLKFLTPVLIPRRFEMTDSEIEFTDSVSNVVEIIQIQDFTLETLSNQLTSNIKIIASFKGDSLQLEGVIGDLPRWIDGNPAEISVQYKFGDMGGELLGSVGQILDDGLFSLRYSVYGDHFATMANLFKLDLVGIEMGSFISQGKLEGTWDSVSFDEVTGSITGRDFHMDFSGSVLDMFRQNIVQMDLRARSVSFDLLHLFGHEFSSFDGITNINAKLYGESSRSFGLKDVDISSRSSMFEIKATGEVSALGTNPQFKIEFESQTDRLKDFLALLDYEIPIDGSGTADGFLIRDGDNYQIDGLILSADTPELAFQATGEVSALGQTPEFNLGFKLLNLGEIDLSWFWNEQSPFDLGFLTEVTGSVVAAGGTIVASGLSLDLMGQKLLGHFSGRLPSLGHSSLADWSLRLTSDDIGELATAFGLDWIYPEHGELNVQVRPSVNRVYDLQLQAGLLANGVNLNISGDMTGFDKDAAFNLRYLINASAFSKNDKIFWDGLNRIGSFRLDGSLIRVKGVREPTTVSLRLNSNKLGVLIAEGSIFSMNSMGSRLDLSIATDSISKFMSVASVRMANVRPFQGDASVRLTNGSVLLDDFHFRVGNNDLFGAIEYRRGVITGTRPSIKADVESAYLNLNELFPPPTKTFLFSEEPLPAGWAISHDVSVQFKVGRFLRRNYDLRGLVGGVTSLSGVVDAHSRSSAFGGDLELTLNLDTRPTPFKAVYQYNWNDLDLALLPVARKAAPEITGRVDLKGGITGEGRSLHQIVERGDGYLFVDVEQARFLRGGMELFTTSPINIVEQILREVSPWGQREKFFDIECGVIGIRIKNGVGVALPPPEHTIAIKAKEFRLAGFGDLQLSDESLSLSVRSKARGLGFSSATLIEQSGLSAIYPPFYRIAGSLLSPKVESDPEGSDLVETLLKLGSAYVTGGTSVALLGLIDRLAIEPVGCEGARDRALKLVPK